MLAPFGVGLAVYVMIGALVDPIERIGLFRAPFAVSLARARGLPRSAWGTAVAHFAAGMLLFGVIAESQWNAERIVTMKPGETVSVRGYDLTLDGLLPRQGPNYRELVARFTVRRDGQIIDVLEPSKRTFPQREMSTTEAALLTRGASQLYLSLGDVGADGAIAVRLYHKPLVLLIWFGCIVMVVRWRALALRPAAARRRAEARAQDCAAAGGVSMRVLAQILFALILLGGPALAVQPEEILKDPVLESRARALSQELRCMVCQNQSIDDSEAPLAKDLRVLVRERLTAGDSDNQVIDFLVARYGEFVLLKPRFTMHTLLLWLAPFAVLAIAAIGFLAAGRRAKTPSAAEPKLSEDEEARLAALVKD